MICNHLACSAIFCFFLTALESILPVQGFSPHKFPYSSRSGLRSSPPPLFSTPRYDSNQEPTLEEIRRTLQVSGIEISPTATPEEVKALYYRQSTTQPGRQGRQPSRSRRSGRNGRRQPSSTSRAFQRMESSDDEEGSGRVGRRRLRQQGQAPSTADTLFRVVSTTTRKVADILPGSVVDLGSKATKIASRKTKQVFDELVDLTYDDDDIPEAVPVGGRKERMFRREGGDRSKSSRRDYEESAPQAVRRETLNRGEQHPHRRRTVRAIPISRLNTYPSSNQDEFVPESLSAQAKMPKVSTQQSRASTRPNSQEVVPKPKIPIHDILTELDKRGVTYGVDATRMELEKLIFDTNRTDQRKESNLDIPEDDSMDPLQTRESPSWGRVLNKTSKVVSDNAKKIPRRVVSTGAKMTGAIRDKAKDTLHSAQTTSSSVFRDSTPSEEEDVLSEIVDAVIEGYSRIVLNDDDDQRIIDVESISPDLGSTKRRKNRTTRSYSSKSQSQRPGERRKRGGAHHSAGVTSYAANSKARYMADYPDVFEVPRLPPAQVGNGRPPTRKRSRRTSSDTGRRIYAPYATDGDEYNINTDGLDQFGDFIATSVDSILWGSADRETKSRGPRRQSQNQKTNSASSGRKRSGHWKDRMEEQFDYLMGIHKDGQYYNRWVNEEVDYEGKSEGADSVSYAQGRAPRRGSGRRIFERPVWEEQGSVLSLLFGTGRQRGNRDWSPTIFGSGSLLKAFQTLLRSFAVVGNALGRWASVRGSLPQPVVVVGVLAAGLSSRPGTRIRNVLLALLALRTMGELLHGYIYDETDFWDPDNDEGQDPMAQEHAM